MLLEDRELKLKLILLKDKMKNFLLDDRNCMSNHNQNHIDLVDKRKTILLYETFQKMVGGWWWW